MAQHMRPSRNLELKVQCPQGSLDEMSAQLAALVRSPIQRFHQIDTYFRVAHGRLKLREFRGGDPASTQRAELIAYARPTDAGSRWSSYQVVPIAADAAAALLAGLLMTHDRLADVDKVRQVALVGDTRVHLDRVADLGAFVELETVITTQTDAEAAAEHQAIIALLGLADYPSIAGSYSDLVLANGMPRNP